MTIVIAQQFGERIVIQSDTAITNEPTGPDVIPGRLKAIILSPKISVAFAGAADRADWAIRQSRGILRSNGLQGLLDWLVQHTQATDEYWDNSVSYIVASHLNGAELYRLWDGRCSRPLSETWVGDQAALRAFRQAECQAPTEYIDGHSIEDENRFGIAFNELFYSSRHGADFSIRGFAVNLLASPLGHCYQPMTVSYDPNPIKIGSGVGGGQGHGSKVLGSGVAVSTGRGIVAWASQVPWCRNWGCRLSMPQSLTDVQRAFPCVLCRRIGTTMKLR